MDTASAGATPRPWYQLVRPDETPTPALLVYPERVERNIDRALEIAGGPGRLWPHVKTHKQPRVVKMHQARGVDRFKCATIAEAEMLAGCSVAEVLLAYQPVGPGPRRLAALASAHPATRFGCIVDAPPTVSALSVAATEAGVTLAVWIDIDNGNGRTGCPPGPGVGELATATASATGLDFAGLHVYDGHLTGLAITERIRAAEDALRPVWDLVPMIEKAGLEVRSVVVGGSPTFPVHAADPRAFLSPGTYAYWDAGYATRCPELPFEPAAVLMTRVVSAPGAGRLCLDLGHKAVGSENPLERRVQLLELPDARFVLHKEEHLVVDVDVSVGLGVGDVLYGLPWHVCPTVALHQEALAVNGRGEVVERWPTLARDRRLTV